MPTEALICPSCQAPVTSGPNADGDYTCGYCSTMFRRSVAQSPPVVVANSSGSPGGAQTQTANKNTGVVAGVIAAVLLMAGAIGALALMPAEAQDPSRPEVPSPSPVEPLSSAPVTTPVANPNPRASAPAPAKVKVEPEVAPSATFEFHSKYGSSGTSYYILGEVTNTSPFAIGQPKVNVVLLDAQGQEVGTDFGFAEADALDAGASAPIKILVSDPPEHAEIRYELVPKKPFYIPAKVSGLRVEPMPPKAARFGNNRFEIEGKVFNEGEQPAKFVEVVIKGVNAEGKIVGLDSTYADGDVLAPGSMARFKALSVATSGPVDHFEFSVDARPAD